MWGWPFCCFGTESHSQQVASWGLCMEQLASAPGAHPPKVSGVGAPPGSQCGQPAEVSGVGPQSADLGARNRASGERRWGCLSRIHSPGAEGGGAPVAVAAAESSLTSC